MSSSTSAVEPQRISGTGPLSIVAEILPRGAALRRLQVTDAHGERRNVVLGHQDPESYGRLPSYLGVTVGRYANRIGAGRFTLDGRAVTVTTNEGGNALHGGTDGFDRRDWEVVERTADSVALRLISPDGDQGFPGTVRVYARYALDGDDLTIEYAAVTDAPTVVSLTNHAYLNLEGEASGSVDEHVLQVEADAFTPVGPDLVPTGAQLAVAGTSLDWREPTPVGSRVARPEGELAGARGVDHNFVLRTPLSGNDDDADTTDRSGLHPAATLVAPVSGLRLQVATDQPGLQVYTGQYLDGTLTGTSGTAYGPRAGLALETQQFPDAPNQPTFPPVTLRPGERYAATTRWRFSHL